MDRKKLAFAVIVLAAVTALALSAPGCGSNGWRAEVEEEPGLQEAPVTGVEESEPGEAAGEEPSGDALEGRYVNQHHTCESFELKADGTFVFVDNHKPGEDVTGAFEIYVDRVTLLNDDGSEFMSFTYQPGTLIQSPGDTPWKKQ